MTKKKPAYLEPFPETLINEPGPHVVIEGYETGHIENPKAFTDAEIIEGFEAGLEALCKRYGVILRHEDGHGCAYLVRSDTPYSDIPVSYFTIERKP